MKDESKSHHRRSIRVRGYDYSQAGAYFVTICAKNREFVFGKIIDTEMRLNDTGRIVQECWNDLPSRFAGIELDAFVTMPNHIHGIIIIVGARLALPKAGAASSAPTLGDIIRAFKSISAINVNRMLSRSGQSLWQRNYYEHVIRNEKSLNKIHEYIIHNPLRWSLDRENPYRKGEDDFDHWLASFKKRPDKRKKR